MIRFSLFLAFFSLVFSLSAQKAESVFLDQRILNWYDQEVKTLDNAISEVLKDRSNFEAKKQVKKSIEGINKTCLSLYNQMDHYLDEERLTELKAGSFESFTNKLEFKTAEMRNAIKDSHLKELLLTREDAELFLNNLSKIKNIEDALVHIKYNLADKSLKSGAVANQLTSVSELAQQNNQIIKSNFY